MIGSVHAHSFCKSILQIHEVEAIKPIEEVILGDLLHEIADTVHLAGRDGILGFCLCAHDERKFLREINAFSIAGVFVALQGHRILMKLMYSQAIKTPDDKLTAEAKAIKETYGQAIDFVNFDTLKPVLEAL